MNPPQRSAPTHAARDGTTQPQGPKVRLVLAFGNLHHVRDDFKRALRHHGLAPVAQIDQGRVALLRGEAERDGVAGRRVGDDDLFAV